MKNNPAPTPAPVRGPEAIASRNAGHWQLRPDVHLDSRRAVWFPTERVLAVADLHLGYSWAKRASGQLFPVEVHDDACARLASLQVEYQPREIVLLGDVVHRALDHPAVIKLVQELTDVLEPACRLRWVGGNHDRGLGVLLGQFGSGREVEAHVRVGPHVLRHGDDANGRDGSPVLPQSGGLTVMGHEHPAIWLGDGVTRGAKCPCFLASPDVLILPAFSNWAAGVPVQDGQWMSALARAQTFTRAIAVLGQGLIPIPLVKPAAAR